jgi:hypothetical protein
MSESMQPQNSSAEVNGPCLHGGYLLRSILEELARIQSHDIILPTTTHGHIRLRCVTQPDPAPAALLDRLGIILPKRMRLVAHEAAPGHDRLNTQLQQECSANLLAKDIRHNK